MPGRLQMPDAARWGAFGRNGIADVVGMLPVRGLLSVRWCCGLRPVPSCCPPSPPGGHGGGGPGVQCRGARCRRGLLPFPALPAGRGKFLRRASPSWAVGGWLPPVARLWSSTGPPSPALPLNLSSTQDQDQTRQHQQQTPAASPKEKSTLETPYRPVAAVAVPRRESRVVLVAVPTGGPCLPGRTPASPHLCRLSPCAVGFVQNPSSACPRHVYRAKLKQRGVRGE